MSAPDNRTHVDSGALQMALNVLRRAGKNEVAFALESTAVRMSEPVSSRTTVREADVLLQKTAQVDVRAILEGQGVFLDTPAIDSIVAAALHAYGPERHDEIAAWQGRSTPAMRWQEVPADLLEFRRDIQKWEMRPLYAKTREAPHLSARSLPDGVSPASSCTPNAGEAMHRLGVLERAISKAFVCDAGDLPSVSIALNDLRVTLEQNAAPSRAATPATESAHIS